MSKDSQEGENMQFKNDPKLLEKSSGVGLTLFKSQIFWEHENCG